MATKRKTRKKLIAAPKTDIDQVRDHSNDPFVLEKSRKAKAFLEKYGFPEEFKSRSSQK